MALPRLAELPDISEMDRLGLQGIIGMKKIAEWQELFRSAAFDLIRTVTLSDETERTLRAIQKGILSGASEYNQANIEKKLGIKLLVVEVGLEVANIIAPVTPPTAPAAQTVNPFRRGRPQQSRKATGGKVFIATNRTPSVLPVRQTPPVRQTQVGEQEVGEVIEKEADIAYVAPKLETEQDKGKKHASSVENDMLARAGTPEGDIYIGLIGFLRDEIPAIAWELPLFTELTIHQRTKRVRNISIDYWARIKCNDKRRAVLLDAFTGFFG